MRDTDFESQQSQAGGLCERPVKARAPSASVHGARRAPETSTERSPRKTLCTDSRSNGASSSEVTTPMPADVAECGAYMAHEMNQPLAAILCNAETALEWLLTEKPDVEAARRAVGHVIGNCERVGHLVGSIRNSMRESSTAATEDVDLAQMVEVMLDATASHLARHGVTCEFEAAQGLPTIKGDRGQLERVVSNLIANAVEAMSDVYDRPRRLRARVELDGSSSLAVRITDTGTGIDPAHLLRIFEPWFTTKTDGLGLGLSICHSIIKSHGGMLCATPHPPHGSVFSFTLPVTKRVARRRATAHSRTVVHSRTVAPAAASACA